MTTALAHSITADSRESWRTRTSEFLQRVIDAGNLMNEFPQHHQSAAQHQHRARQGALRAGTSLHKNFCHIGTRSSLALAEYLA